MAIQTDLMNVSKCFPEDAKLKTVANNMCLACCCLEIMGIKDKNKLEIIVDEIGKGLDSECTVSWQPFFEHVSGRKVKVDFKPIKDLKELKDVKGPIPVRFDYNGDSHWVLLENQKIKYNSLEKSECVNKGKPATARIITFQ